MRKIIAVYPSHPRCNPRCQKNGGQDKGKGIMKKKMRG